MADYINHLCYLVDFENTDCSGLAGSRYLRPGDQVILFYSNDRNRIRRGAFDDLTASGAAIRLIKLQGGPAKNAMDFYITSCIGEIVGSGSDYKIAILSKDKGYAAVVDYWAKCAEHPCRIAVSPNISEAVICLEDKEATRKAAALLARQTVVLGEIYDSWKKESELFDIMGEAMDKTKAEEAEAGTKTETDAVPSEESQESKEPAAVTGETPLPEAEEKEAPVSAPVQKSDRTAMAHKRASWSQTTAYLLRKMRQHS